MTRTQSTAKIATERGGGVLIGVREEIKSAALPELDACCEILWVKIFTRGNKHAHICAYYRPNVADKASLLSFDTSLRRASDAHNPTLLIAGDFNFPGWNWRP